MKHRSGKLLANESGGHAQKYVFAGFRSQQGEIPESTVDRIPQTRVGEYSYLMLRGLAFRPDRRGAGRRG